MHSCSLPVQIGNGLVGRLVQFGRVTEGAVGKEVPLEVAPGVLDGVGHTEAATPP